LADEEAHAGRGQLYAVTQGEIELVSFVNDSL